VAAAARDADYTAAVRHGEQAVAARLDLAAMNPMFTVHVIGAEAETAQGGAMWFPGEVEQYRQLARLTGGPAGQLVAKLPLVWTFRRGPPVPEGWTYGGGEQKPGATDAAAPASPPADRGAGQPVRTDLYLQAQGIVGEGPVSALGHYWYETAVDLTPDQLRG